jgi:hypothetical protein
MAGDLARGSVSQSEVPMAIDNDGYDRLEELTDSFVSAIADLVTTSGSAILLHSYTQVVLFRAAITRARERDTARLERQAELAAKVADHQERRTFPEWEIDLAKAHPEGPFTVPQFRAWQERRRGEMREQEQTPEQIDELKRKAL